MYVLQIGRLVEVVANKYEALANAASSKVRVPSALPRQYQFTIGGVSPPRTRTVMVVTRDCHRISSINEKAVNDQM